MGPDEKPRVASFAIFGRFCITPGFVFPGRSPDAAHRNSNWRIGSKMQNNNHRARNFGVRTVLQINPDISYFLLRLSLTPGFSPCHYPHLFWGMFKFN
jgi:hypothetical protein